MFKEFKQFALRGNVVDLAVGVLIAGAFGKIISSLVNDIFMPLFGVLLGGVNFTDLKYVITPATGTKAESAIYYGAFIQSVVDFLIIAFSLFLFIKLLASVQKNETLAKIAPPVSYPNMPAASPPPSGGSSSPSPSPPPAAATPPAKNTENTEKLLAEIRDLLKQK